MCIRTFETESGSYRYYDGSTPTDVDTTVPVSGSTGEFVSQRADFHRDNFTEYPTLRPYSLDLVDTRTNASFRVNSPDGAAAWVQTFYETGGDPLPAFWQQGGGAVEPVDAPPANFAQSVKFAYYRPGSISGKVYADQNGNGAQDAGEAGVPGVSVSLPNQAPVVTGSDGSYKFENVPPAPVDGVLVSFDLRPTYTPTTGTIGTLLQPSPAGPVVPLSGRDVNGGNIGVFQQVFASGKVYVDHNANGHQDPDDEPARFPDVYVQVIVDTNANGNGFGSGSSPNDDQGNFDLDGVGPGVVRLDAVYLALSDLRVTEGSAGYPLVSGQDVAGLKFGVTEGTPISGTVQGAVFDDLNKNGKRDRGAKPEGPAVGVTVELDDGSSSPQTAVTDAAGAYRFTGVGPKPFHVRIAPRPEDRQTVPADPAGYAGAVTADGQTVTLPELGRYPETDVLLTAATRKDDAKVTASYEAFGRAGDISVGLYRSADEAFDAKDVSAAPAAVVRLPGGSRVTGDLTFTFATKFVHDPNRPYLLVVVDPKKKVPEADEENNARTVDRVIDLAPYELDGEFAYDAPRDAFTSVGGSADLGFKPASGRSFVPLVNLAGAVTYDAESIRVHGAVTSLAEAGDPRKLFTGSWAWDYHAGAPAGMADTGAADGLKLATVPFRFTSLTLKPTDGPNAPGGYLEAHGAFESPLPFAAATGRGNILLRVDGANSLQLRPAGVRLVGTLTFPRIMFELPGGVKVEATGLAVSYSGAPLDTFKFQGKLSLQNLYLGTSVTDLLAENPRRVTASVSADLSGENYFQFGRAGWDVVGSLTSLSHFSGRIVPVAGASFLAW